MKVLICNSYGGFGLSRKGAEFLAARGNDLAQKDIEMHENWLRGLNGDGTPLEDPRLREARMWLGQQGSYCSEVARTDPDVIAMFEELGQEAAGEHCHLALVEIPDGVDFYIDEYDGKEWVAESHRTWYGDAK